MRNNKDERILSALISCPTIRAASKKCDVSETQIYARLKDDGFRKRYDDLRLSIVDAAVQKLQQSITTAADTVISLASDNKIPAAVRLSAAKTVMELALRMAEYSRKRRDEIHDSLDITNLTRAEIEALTEAAAGDDASLSVIVRAAAAAQQLDAAEGKLQAHEINFNLF